MSRFIRTCALSAIVPLLACVVIGTLKGLARPVGMKVAEDFALGVDLMVAALILQLTLLAGHLDVIGIETAASRDANDGQVVIVLLLLVIMLVMVAAQKRFARPSALYPIDSDGHELDEGETTYQLPRRAALTTTFVGILVLFGVLAANLFMLGAATADE